MLLSKILSRGPGRLSNVFLTLLVVEESLISFICMLYYIIGCNATHFGWPQMLQPWRKRRWFKQSSFLVNFLFLTFADWCDWVGNGWQCSCKESEERRVRNRKYNYLRQNIWLIILLLFIEYPCPQVQCDIYSGHRYCQVSKIAFPFYSMNCKT